MDRAAGRIHPGRLHRHLRLLARSEAAWCGLLAAAASGLVAAFVPAGGDASAHLYRILLVQEGALVWDNFWYAGHYPLASYSVLYYFPAALVGNELIQVAAAVASAGLFAALVTAEWGDAARWPARVFALLSCAPLLTGEYPYGLGIAALLATLRALQLGRPWLASACAALTLGLSPLAFVLLCLTLLAIWLASGCRLSRRPLLFALGLAALAGAGAVALGAFRAPWIDYPFPAGSLIGVLAASALGAGLALRIRRSAVLASFFLLWALASTIAFLLPTPIGANISRPRLVFLPLVLLAAALTRFKPRAVALIALAFALPYTLDPYHYKLVSHLQARTDDRAYWKPVLSFLRRHPTSNHRVEVVPTGSHWEAYYLPRAGFPLARGWYRQLDLAYNPLLYRKTVAPPAYERWLRSLAVRYVLLSPRSLDGSGADAEADLLRSGRSGLAMVFRRRNWRIYALPKPTPLLTGPAPARLTAFRHEQIAGWLDAPGVFKLRVRYSPHWRAGNGAVCLSRARDGMTHITASGRGSFLLEAKDPDELRFTAAAACDGGAPKSPPG